MAQKGDIGKIIKKVFDTAQKSPDDALWKRIDASLEKRKQKRKFILLFSLGLGTLGLILLILINIFPFTKENKLTNTDPSDKKIHNQLETKTQYSKSGKDEKDSEKLVQMLSDTTISNNSKDALYLKNQTNNLQNNQTTITAKDKENTINGITETQNKNNKKYVNNREENILKSKKRDAVLVKKIVNNENIPTENTQTSFNETETVEIKEQNKDSILGMQTEEKLASQEKDSLKEELSQKPDPVNTEDRKIKKWGFTVIAGPTLYNSFDKGSIIDTRLDTYNRKGTFEFSYGFAFRVELEKFSISYGANKTQLSYVTQNIPSSNETEINTILSFTDFTTGNTITSTELTGFLEGESTTDLLHKIEYIEMPLMFTYDISQKRLGFQTSAGISTYLFRKDDMYSLNNNGEELKIGNAKRLSEMRFSFNFGLGAYYKLSDNLFLELNPMMKYSLTKASNRSSGDNPFLIGVYTGLTYKLF